MSWSFSGWVACAWVFAVKELSMTEDEMFRKFGCGCRALIKLCELKGKPITQEYLIEKFRPHFGKRWETQLGITATSDLIYMAQNLEICNFADTHVSINYVRERLRKQDTEGIFLITDNWFNQDGELLEPFYHCSLLLQIDQKQLEVHTREGAENTILHLDLLPVLRSHFLVLG